MNKKLKEEREREEKRAQLREEKNRTQMFAVRKRKTCDDEGHSSPHRSSVDDGEKAIRVSNATTKIGC